MDVCIVVGMVVFVAECVSLGVVLCMIRGVVLVLCVHSVDQELRPELLSRLPTRDGVQTL